MAMTKCSECGHAISTLAATCPSCGAPQTGAPAPTAVPTQPQVRRPFKIAAGVVGLLFAFVVIYGALHPKASTAVRPVEISLEHLQSAYAQNTVAADAQFKGRALLLTAPVQNINTGIGGGAYLVLGSPDQFLAPQAELAESDRGQAAGLRPGSIVRLLCTGAGDIAKTPMLIDCHFQATVASNNQPGPAATAQAVPAQVLDDPSAWSEQEMDERFQCPESYGTDDQQKAALAQMVDWYGKHHRPVTVQGLIAYRMRLLQTHHCSQTLENLARHGA